MIDSTYEPPGDFEAFNDLDRSKRFIDTEEDCTTTHGSIVTQLLTMLTTNPTWQFYQVIDEHGEFDDGDLLDAIVWATDYGADVLNLSLGAPHISDEDKDCDHTGPACGLGDAIEYALDENVTIVAAVGNEPNVEAVCCPALYEDVIAVGGCVATCEASPDRKQKTQPQPQDLFRPPMALWIDRADEDGCSGPYCSNKGCGPGEECEKNREIKPWRGNPRFLNDTPDTLAPTYFPRKAKEGAVLAEGTSFSTPIVTAAILNIIEGIRHADERVHPSEFREAIRVTGNPLEEVPVGILDAKALGNEVFQQKDLGPILEEVPNDYDLNLG